jgi:phosphomannomutase
MECPKAAVFDLDDTLAKSLEAPAPEMTARLRTLLERMPVAIITGRAFTLVEPGFLPALAASPHMDRFYLLPEAGAECLQRRDDAWQPLYTHAMSDDDAARIRATIDDSLRETGAYEGLPVFGERYIRKHTMYTLMALGIDVKGEMKYSWDPGNARRKKLWRALSDALPEFDVVMGGATAIDITPRGINKAYGIRWLAEHLALKPSDMLYVGDALFEGGNDEAVIPTGIQTRSTSGPEETARIIGELLEACGVQ